MAHFFEDLKVITGETQDKTGETQENTQDKTGEPQVTVKDIEDVKAAYDEQICSLKNQITELTSKINNNEEREEQENATGTDL